MHTGTIGALGIVGEQVGGTAGAQKAAEDSRSVPALLQRAKAMADNGVVIGRSWPIWPQRVRVSVGTEDEMATFRKAFAKVAGVPA